MCVCVCALQLHYEQQISELEQKLAQRQTPEVAVPPPPCPSAEGSEQPSVTTEAQHSVELALQEQIQSLQQQLSRKVLHTPPHPGSEAAYLGRYARQ